MRGGIIRRGGMMGCLWMFIRRWWGRCVGRGGGGVLEEKGVLEEGEEVGELCNCERGGKRFEKEVSDTETAGYMNRECKS